MEFLSMDLAFGFFHFMKVNRAHTCCGNVPTARLLALTIMEQDCKRLSGTLTL